MSIGRIPVFQVFSQGFQLSRHHLLNVEMYDLAVFAGHYLPHVRSLPLAWSASWDQLIPHKNFTVEMTVARPTGRSRS